MKYQKPVNTVQNNDEFSSGLMEAYTNWMGGDCFQNTDPVDLNLHEAPFDGMDPQSHGAEIEDTTKRKKEPKKAPYVGQESAPKNEEYEVLEREEYEVDGQVYVIEKKKGLDGKACWKGYKQMGTKMKGGKRVDNCVKAGDELSHEGEDLQEKAVSKAQQKFMGMVHATKKGEMKGGSDEVKKAAKSMSDKSAEEYASTKHKGLPEKKTKKEEFLPEKKLDPVGKEDKDIDNDGDHDKSDKYLLARRKKIGKILAMKGKK